MRPWWLRLHGQFVSGSTPPPGTMSAARISRSTAMTLNGSGDTAVVYDTTDFDDGGYVNLGAHPTRLTIPATGFYVYGFFHHVNASGFQNSTVRLNGGSTPIVATSPANNSADWRCAVANGSPFNAGDFIEVVHVLFGSGSLDETPNFWIARLV